MLQASLTAPAAILNKNHNISICDSDGRGEFPLVVGIKTAPG
jgi:hypothetical protein